MRVKFFFSPTITNAGILKESLSQVWAHVDAEII